jgi:DNA-binding transcriptional ArsR family regulator
MDELEVISALRALGEQKRWRVMRLLVSSEHGMAAGDIAEALQVRQNTLSSHMGSPDAMWPGRRTPAGPENRLFGRFKKRPQACGPGFD